MASLFSSAPTVGSKRGARQVKLSPSGRREKIAKVLEKAQDFNLDSLDPSSVALTSLAWEGNRVASKLRSNVIDHFEPTPCDCAHGPHPYVARNTPVCPNQLPYDAGMKAFQLEDVKVWNDVPAEDRKELFNSRVAHAVDTVMSSAPSYEALFGLCVRIIKLQRKVPPMFFSQCDPVVVNSAIRLLALRDSEATKGLDPKVLTEETLRELFPQ
jgi:hypothetical protein